MTTDRIRSESREREQRSPSTTSYLKLVFLNPISAAGIVVAVAGILLISLGTPAGGEPPRPPLFAAGLMLFGIVVFALGYTRAQRIIKRRDE